MMQRCRIFAYLLLTALLPIFATVVAWSEETLRPDIVFAMSPKAVPEIDPIDATAALKVWVTQIAKRMGYTAESYFFDSIERIIHEMNSGRIDSAALSSVDYLRAKGSLDGEVALAHVKGGKISDKYLLIVKRSFGYKKTSDLKGKRLIVLKGDEVGPVFLNTILLRHRFPEMKTFFSKVQEKPKPSQVVLSVFFDQADAALVNEVSFKTVVEMNPQVGRELISLISSKELVSSILVFRRSFPEDRKQKLIHVCKTFKDDIRGRQVLMLFKIEDLAPVKEADLASVKDLLSEYEKLRAKR